MTPEAGPLSLEAKLELAKHQLEAVLVELITLSPYLEGRWKQKIETTRDEVKTILRVITR